MKKIFILLHILILCLSQNANAFGAFKMQMSSGQHVVTMDIDKIITESCSLSLFEDKTSQIITGLSVTGYIEKKSNDYLVRIILLGNDGHEFMVLESYNMINSEISFKFDNYCEETALLDCISPKGLKIVVKDAVLHLTSLGYLDSSGLKISRTAFEKKKKIIKSEQIENVVSRINDYNMRNRIFWVADNTELAQKSFEERKRILGYPDEVSTFGYEYYYDGIFELGGRDTRSFLRANASGSNYVNTFDWRNRHGKNWITSNKDQGESNYCTGFTVAACLEAMTNLYFNQKIDLNLSAQEISCCSRPNFDTYYYGLPADYALDYARNFGVCDSLSYPFVGAPGGTCQDGFITPIEKVYINNYSVVNKYSESELKRALINYGPLVSGYIWYDQTENGEEWNGHKMLLVGYKTIEVGDTLRISTREGLTINYFIIPTDTFYIGKTYWTFKNSRGYDYDTMLRGYRHIVFNNYSYMGDTYCVNTPITTNSFCSGDVVCEDYDGDGYYYWGIGSKPSYCPSWIPDEPDGDDSDYDYGPMDEYGNLTNLQNLIAQTIVVSTNTAYSQPRFNYGITVVVPNTTLTVTSDLTLYGNVHIQLSAGSKLVIDGGTINNAKFMMIPGCEVVVKNGGVINMRNGIDFELPVGAVLNLENGIIK